jgi:hypothetical protein
LVSGVLVTMKTPDAKARVAKKPVSSTTGSHAAPTTPKSKTPKTGKPGTPKASDVAKDVRPVVDYSEALDLEEPTEEQVEQEVRDGMDEEKPGKALTEVRDARACQLQAVCMHVPRCMGLHAMQYGLCPCCNTLNIVPCRRSSFATMLWMTKFKQGHQQGM